MAGKSNKGRNKKVSNATGNTVEPTASSNATSEAKKVTTPEGKTCDVDEIPSNNRSTDPTPEVQETDSENSAGEVKQGELHLYPVSVKTQSGEKLELQLNPGDSVMDIKQFLLDAPETCFFTCYDLLLHTKDGSIHELGDFNEIAEVADITLGGCFLEMVAAIYDEKSIRAHVHRARDLLYHSSNHSSLSTSIALEYEASKEKPSSVTGKSEVSELDGVGFMEDVPESLSKLHRNPSKKVKCIESIVFSSLNPPPSYRKMVGDLIYLDVVTLEGNKYCITGTVHKFYANSSIGDVLDPTPAKSASDSTTLIGLLQKISPKFKKDFREILEQKAAAHPFENVQSTLSPNSWLAPFPIPEHRRDAARAEEALTLVYGSELIGMQRDWNEELQSCREFPRTSPHERILRDRALYKVASDFVDAAMKGAVGVINRCIPPINPTDPDCFHMYVHNNIFFSFAVDADVELLSRKRISNAVFKSENTFSHGVSQKRSHDPMQIDSVTANGGDGTSSSHDIIVQETSEKSSSESHVTESEQATYASANNDLKGTKAYQETGVSGLYNLAMAIIDYRGHRVVAQSVLPGILQGDKSDSLLYGSVDNGKKICWNEEFHSKVLEAAKKLKIKEHTVLDASGKEFKLAAPVECKGIVGSDDRHYLLDLMRVTPRDANYTGSGSRFCVLRPELIASFCQSERAKKSVNKDQSSDSNIGKDSKSTAVEPDKIEERVSNSGAIDGDGDVCTGNSSDPCDEILFNPNVFTEFKLAGDPEEIANDERNVRKASSYLMDVVLPKFIQDLCSLEVSPMDGQTLTEALHAHGINVRYIGKITDGTKHLPHLWELCSNEIVVRSAKHIFKDILRETEDHEVGPAVSHFLNCFFGNCQPLFKGAANPSLSKATKKDSMSHHSPRKSSRGHQKLKLSSSCNNHSSSYMSLSSSNLWSDIREFAKLKYQFELPEDAEDQIKKVSVLRNICLKVGITLAARKYDLNAAAPFQTSDVVDLLPVVKHSIPVCSEAKDLIETGKAQLAEGMHNEAYSLFSEAFSILQQVTGPMHREVTNCCRYLAMVLYHAGDMAGAIMQQHKELIINERCLGLDHPDTAHSYGNMALFYHGLNQTEVALRHMSRALLLLSLSSGPDHPDVAATFINVAMMYQDIGKMDTALRYLQEALKKNERLLGEDHIQTAVCYHALAIAFNCMGAFKLSHQHEKKTYDILVKQLGEDDSRTRDSQNWIKTFKMRELQVNAQKQKGQGLDSVSAQKAIDILKANPDLMHAFQAAAVAGKPGNYRGRSLNAGLMGGRGMDERAVRAAAEVRKKAAAKGLLIRPHAPTPHNSPPLNQLLNMMNTEMSTDLAGESSGGTNEGKEISPPNASIDLTKEVPSVRNEQIPVGLGKGLILDNKKAKMKTKAAT